MTSKSRIDFISDPAGPIKGTIQVPGDKSITHRGIILGAISDGKSIVRHYLDSEDIKATIDVFNEMGVKIDRTHDAIEIHGVGLNGLTPPDKPLYFGNSGTSVRLMAGVLAGQSFNSELLGDESLMKRPMGRIVDPLRMMRAEVQCDERGTLPIRITGGKKIIGINYQTPVASAQLKSCLLFAGLYAEGQTSITEPVATRDHTERMLGCFGSNITKTDLTINITAGKMHGSNINVPGDISSAAFFIIAACLSPGSDLLLKNVGINPTRNAVIEILTRMGANISVHQDSNNDAEPVADIRICYQPLTGIEIPIELVPNAIDEFPAILVAAASAQGDTVLTGAEELRQKESDRIEAMADGLSKLGIEALTSNDGIRVKGGTLLGGEISSYRDHRIAMAFTIAGIAAKESVKIQDCVNVNTSFPGFVDVCRSVGMNVVEQVNG